VRHIDPATLFPALDRARRNAKAPLKFAGRFRQGSPDFPHTFGGHGLNMAAFKRNLAPAMGNGVAQTLFDLQAKL
jgi:hypothetical protein